jgi:hypothetical protein
MLNPLKGEPYWRLRGGLSALVGRNSADFALEICVRLSNPLCVPSYHHKPTNFGSWVLCFMAAQAVSRMALQANLGNPLKLSLM